MGSPKGIGLQYSSLLQTPAARQGQMLFLAAFMAVCLPQDPYPTTTHLISPHLRNHYGPRSKNGYIPLVGEK